MLKIKCKTGWVGAGVKTILCCSLSICMLRQEEERKKSDQRDSVWYEIGQSILCSNPFPTLLYIEDRSARSLYCYCRGSCDVTVDWTLYYLLQSNQFRVSTFMRVKIVNFFFLPPRQQIFTAYSEKCVKSCNDISNGTTWT
jgi:hypothetical protein